jgi:hypothetical protein
MAETYNNMLWVHFYDFTLTTLDKLFPLCHINLQELPIFKE